MTPKKRKRKPRPLQKRPLLLIAALIATVVVYAWTRPQKITDHPIAKDPRPIWSPGSPLVEPAPDDKGQLPPQYAGLVAPESEEKNRKARENIEAPAPVILEPTPSKPVRVEVSAQNYGLLKLKMNRILQTPVQNTQALEALKGSLRADQLSPNDQAVADKIAYSPFSTQLRALFVAGQLQGDTTAVEDLARETFQAMSENPEAAAAAIRQGISVLPKEYVTQAETLRLIGLNLPGNAANNVGGSPFEAKKSGR